MARTREYVEIPVEQLAVNPYNPRENPEDFDDLLQSIKSEGIRTPLTVFKAGKGGYIVADGHRRLAAARHLGLKWVPGYVDSEIKSVGDATLYALLEGNMSRPYTPIERARAYKALIEDLKMGAKQIAKFVGVTEGTILNHLALLNWGPGVQKLVHEDDLPPSVAWSAWRAVKRISERDKKALPEPYVRTGLEKKLLSRSIRRMSDEKALQEFTSQAKPEEVRRWLGSPSEGAKMAMVKAGQYGAFMKMLRGVITTVSRIEKPPASKERKDEMIALLRQCAEACRKAEKVIEGKEVALVG